MRARVFGVVAVCLLWLGAAPARAADRTFESGSLIISMDLSYQATGMFQAYGLVYQLLKHGVRVHWLIDPNKTYHAAPCNSATDPCAWDCEVEGSGIKCPYPTMSPDATATTNVIWDDKRVAPRGSVLGTHRYRGGPFAIAAADRDKALVVIDAWNDQTKWGANPWARRSVFHVVSVHEATSAFTANVARTLISPPTIAVFSDGNEDIATGYLRAAGIPQSSGAEFPDKCGAVGTCGPGTQNPDMLTPEAVAGDLGTCSSPNRDHRNGALFKPNGEPAFCQIMSMHWNVTTRETVTCEGGCPATQAQCTGQRFTFNGHEVVAEVREFLKHPVHFFAECQAVNAYENATPNPAWPFLDDMGRDGHFLTTRGTPPPCPCADADYQCVVGGCNGQDCCLAKDLRERGAGYEIAAAPASNLVKVLRPDIPYNQFDGMFGTVGGSEPAYNLSQFLGTTYKNNRQVTLLTGPNGPGDQDLWMTGYLDGCDDIILKTGGPRASPGCEGKISYLGGHQYSTNVPVASGSSSQGTRLFLNALFEAQCVTGTGPGGGQDTDGDGVPDDQDAAPVDPNQCGDSDADGCDDCSGGHFDAQNDCVGGGTSPGGCCDAGAHASAGRLWLAALVALLLARRRRRRADAAGPRYWRNTKG